MNKILSVLLILIVSGCMTDPTENNVADVSTLSMVQDQEKHNSTSESINENKSAVSDSYQLNTAWFDGWDLNISVSYGGGCKSHQFELIWPEVITMIYPPSFNVFLLHNANGDACEAYITDTLVFDTSVNDLVQSLETLHIMNMGIVNESNPTEVVFPNE